MINNYWYTKPDYGDRTRANVGLIFKKGQLSQAKWGLWNEWYKTRDQWVGKTEKDFPPQHGDCMKQIQQARDQQAEVMGWQMPGAPIFTDLWQLEYPKKDAPAPAR